MLYGPGHRTSKFDGGNERQHQVLQVRGQARYQLFHGFLSSETDRERRDKRAYFKDSSRGKCSTPPNVSKMSLGNRPRPSNVITLDVSKARISHALENPRILYARRDDGEPVSLHDSPDGFEVVGSTTLVGEQCKR